MLSVFASFRTLEGVYGSLTTHVSRPTDWRWARQIIASTCQSAGRALETGRIRKLATHALQRTRMCLNPDHLGDFWFSLS
jgi:hypothetical protein